MAKVFVAVLWIICANFLAALLLPVSVVFGWARANPVPERAFANSFAPLGKYPAAQSEVTGSVVDKLNAYVDIDAKTDQLFNGIEELGLSTEASEALDLLHEPVKSVTQGVLHEGVEAFVESHVFESTRENALRMSHRALVATINMGESPRCD